MGVGLSLVVAFLAGCGNVLLTNPIWVVATRMQAHEKEERQDGGGRSLSTVQVAREIVDESGVLVRLSILLEICRVEHVSLGMKQGWPGL